MMNINYRYGRPGWLIDWYVVQSPLWSMLRGPQQIRFITTIPHPAEALRREWANRL